jgi:exodeoxyribonuclease VII small subunit
MSLPSPGNQPQPSLCFEDALGELETIVHELEEGQIGLAEALGRYEKGIGLLKQCYGLLENAQRRIEVLTGIDANGNPRTEPLADAEAGSLEEKAQLRSQRRSKSPEPRRRSTASDVDEAAGLF